MNAQDVIKQVTEKVHETANAGVVFGDPIEKGEMTVIPVATTKVAGGGGGGSDKKNEGSGMGLGLKIQTSPIGYIKVKDEQAEFVDIIDKNKIIQSATSIIGIFLVLATLGRMRANRLAHKRGTK